MLLVCSFLTLHPQTIGGGVAERRCSDGRRGIAGRSKELHLSDLDTARQESDLSFPAFLFSCLNVGVGGLKVEWTLELLLLLAHPYGQKHRPFGGGARSDMDVERGALI